MPRASQKRPGEPSGHSGDNPPIKQLIFNSPGRRHSSSDDVAPKRGRPFRKVADGFAQIPERANARRCGECPKLDRNSFCPIRAERRRVDAVACRYGYVLIGASRKSARRAADMV